MGSEILKFNDERSYVIEPLLGIKQECVVAKVPFTPELDFEVKPLVFPRAFN